MQRGIIIAAIENYEKLLIYNINTPPQIENV